jgi:surfactin synthase thioesterase subunit
MGAAIAFELSVELDRRGNKRLPQRMFVSGRNPPHVKRTRENIAHLPDDQFIQGLIKEYRGALPQEILDHPEMLEIVTQVLRADVATNESYYEGPRPSVNIPISALGGKDDPWTTAAALAEWQRYTPHRCSVRMFTGDHFFHQTAWENVVAAVIADLAAAPSQPR